jgi:hypothetical protein
MPRIFNDITTGGVFCIETLADMQLIYMRVCAELRLAPDDAIRRENIALTIVYEFERGNRDTETVAELARRRVREEFA